MVTVFGSLAPGKSSKLNLVYDHLAVAGVTLVVGLVTAPGGVALWPLWCFVLFTAMQWAVGSGALQLYDAWKERVPLDVFALICVLVVAQVMPLALLRLVVPGLAAALPHPGDLILLLLPVVALPRLVVFRRLARHELPIDDVLVVGTGPMARHTGESLQNRHPRRRVAGYLRLDAQSRELVPADQVIGSVRDDLEKCLRSIPIGEVYFAARVTHSAPELDSMVQTCERLGVPFALPAVPVQMGRMRLAAPNNVLDGFIHFVPFASRPAQRAVKRLFDVAVASLGLVVLSPLLLGVALAIKLTSKGPVFFAQARVGLHGRKFKMLKFRSMVVNAEELKAKLAAQNEQEGPVFKIKNDPRITGIGRFIRKYSIDELPQLLNVLRGDMSVVGPRPPVPPEVAQYEPWQLRRLSVRPGLTCIWQVSGRNQISFEDWMYLDMRYIDNWSFWSDLSLILRTVPVVLTGRGAS